MLPGRSGNEPEVQRAQEAACRADAPSFCVGASGTKAGPGGEEHGGQGVASGATGTMSRVHRWQ